MAKKKETQGTAVNIVSGLPEANAASAIKTIAGPGGVPALNFILTKPVNEIPTVYANQAVMRTSAHDVQIIFAQVVNEQAGQIISAPQVVVYMSPAHAKRIAAIIESQIKQYEDTYGPVPVIPEPGAAAPENGSPSKQ